jgi:alkylation response protein AidB-like acyl-CoA dehydrogenase
VDLRLDDEQDSVVDAVRTLLRRAAGPQRAREMSGALDGEAMRRLDEAGFLDAAQGGRPRDHLAALLVTEQAARSLVSAPVGARSLVARYAGLANPPLTIGLAMGDPSIVRWGADVDAVLMLDQGAVRLLREADMTAERVPSRMAYPLARITARPGRGEDLADGTTGSGPGGAAARMTRAWRTVLSAEIAAAMTSAVDVARAYVSARVQFGRPIGSLQAVQHRLAEAHVQAQGSMWLARRAAWQLDSDRPAAVAAAYATSAANTVFDSVHQVVGAIGFTTEFDLHLWSLKLPVLAAELGGPRAHATAVSATRWQRVPTHEEDA